MSIGRSRTSRSNDDDERAERVRMKYLQHLLKRRVLRRFSFSRRVLRPVLWEWETPFSAALSLSAEDLLSRPLSRPVLAEDKCLVRLDQYPQSERLFYINKKPVTLTSEDEESVAIWFPRMGETPTGLAVHDDDKQDRGDKERRQSTSKIQQGHQLNRKWRDGGIMFIVVVLLSWLIYKYNSLDYPTKTSSSSQQPKQYATEDESVVPVRMKRDDELDMTKHIDDKQILAISAVARNEWQEIGINLGFKRHELSGYEYMFRDERLRVVLFAWKGREDNPTVGKVVEACEDAKVGVAVRRTLQKLICGEAENKEERRRSTSKIQQGHQLNRKWRHGVLIPGIMFIVVVLLSWVIYKYNNSLDYLTKTSSSSQRPKQCAIEDESAVPVRMKRDDELDMTKHIDDKQILAVEKFPLPTSCSLCQWQMVSCKEELTLLRCEGDQRIHLLQASYERCIVGKQGCLLGSLSNEWILCIPPGALDYDQEIAVSFYHVDDCYRLAGDQFVTGIIEITPHQLPFAKPVELLLCHHLFIEDQKDEVTCTVLYHSGETDSEPLTGICYLSSKHERARPSDMTPTLWDDFVYVKVSHFGRYGLECTGCDYITVWASMFAPECLDRKQEKQFHVCVSFHSQAPRRNDDQEKMMKEMLNLVRRSFCSVELDCYSKQPLQLKVQIFNERSGWKVQGKSELSQTFPYNVIKDMMVKRKPMIYDILFSKESGIDVTDIRPAFKFNETLCCLRPPVLSSKPSETQNGTLMSNQEMSRTASSVAGASEKTYDRMPPEFFFNADLCLPPEGGSQPDDMSEKFNVDGYGTCLADCTSGKDLVPKIFVSDLPRDLPGLNDDYSRQPAAEGNHSKELERIQAMNSHQVNCCDGDQQGPQLTTHGLDRPVSTRDVELVVSHCEHVTQHWLKIGWLMLKDNNFTIRDIKELVEKDLGRHSDTENFIHLTEVWKSSNKDGATATARALVDICCHPTVGGDRDLIEDLLLSSSSSHNDKEEEERGRSTSKIQQDHQLNRKRRRGGSSNQQPKQCATEDESAVPVRMKRDDELDMTKHIDDKQILAISSVARNEWQKIGISLGFKRHELSGYEHRFRDDLDERLRAVLFAWKKREDNPTVGKVVEACGDAKVGAAVRRAFQKLISVVGQ